MILSEDRSMGEDAAFEGLLEDLAQSMHEEYLRMELWCCRDGRRLKLREMTTEHIRNCVNMIESRKNWRRRWLVRLNTELIRRIP